MPKVPKTSLQNLCTSIKENVKDELDLLAKDKCQRFLEIAIIILGVCVCVCVWPGMPKLSKITSLLFLCNILRTN